MKQNQVVKQKSNSKDKIVKHKQESRKDNSNPKLSSLNDIKLNKETNLDTEITEEINSQRSFQSQNSNKSIIDESDNKNEVKKQTDKNKRNTIKKIFSNKKCKNEKPKPNINSIPVKNFNSSLIDISEHESEIEASTEFGGDLGSLMSETNSMKSTRISFKATNDDIMTETYHNLKIDFKIGEGGEGMV